MEIAHVEIPTSNTLYWFTKSRAQSQQRN